MSDLPASPRAARTALPGWLDTRLVLGVVLVLVSVAVGARLLSTADRTDLVWASVGDLAPGAVVAAGDLRAEPVRLDTGAAGYLDASAPPPVGYVVQRGLLAGELVPRRALRAPQEADYRQVTVEVGTGHAPPDLRGGQLVDVYVTAEQGGTRRLLSRVAVASVPAAGGFTTGGDGRAIVLNVRPEQVLELVQGVGGATVDLVRVPTDALVQGS